MICSYCGKDNVEGKTICDYCGKQLFSEYTITMDYGNGNYGNNQNEMVNNKLAKGTGCLSNVISIIKFGPFLLIGFLFFLVGTWSFVSEHIKTQGYEKTVGVLVDFKDCEIDEEDGSQLCTAVYEYTVNNHKYTVSPAELSDKSGFDHEQVVYYNPDNPSEAIIYAGWEILAIVGAIILVILTIIITRKNKRVKKTTSIMANQIIMNNKK